MPYPCLRAPATICPTAIGNDAEDDNVPQSKVYLRATRPSRQDLYSGWTLVVALRLVVALTLAVALTPAVDERFKRNPGGSCQGNQAEHIIGRRIHGAGEAPSDDYNGPSVSFQRDVLGDAGQTVAALLGRGLRPPF